MNTARQIGRDAKELWRLCLVRGSLDESRARLVANGLAESRRAGALTILKTFLRLVKLDRARGTALIASASPLDADVRADVEDGLARRYGRDIAASFVVDPSLIGGMCVTIGSELYDGSVRAGLAALEARC